MFSRFKALQKYGEGELEDIRSSKVAVIGLGATGSVIAEHLARHGVELTLIDRDYLERNDVYSSNIYTPEDCKNSVPKAIAAEEYLSKFTEVDSKVESLNSENINLLESADLILDGTDNLDTRLLIDEYSNKTDIPWIYTAAIGEKGYSMLFDDKCFNCVFEDVQGSGLGSCETEGILREVSTIAASLSTRKAVRYLAGKEIKENLDTVSGDSYNVESKGCKICENEDYSQLNSERKISTVCGENKYQLERKVSEESLEHLKEAAEIISENEYLLRVKINGRELTAFRSGRVIVEAEDQGHAEAIVTEMGI